jgi:SAM-dependent methyltransferase
MLAMHDGAARRTRGARFLPKPFVFDLPMQAESREVKIEFLRRVIGPWMSGYQLHTALDLGCGVGYFSAMLRDLGMQVTAMDGRVENIAEARDRHSGIDFRVADAEDPSLTALGAFDLVFCLGLLYHLENPLRAVRNLHALTGKILIVESMVIPEEQPFFILMDEGNVEDQSLRAVSCYPSEGAIIKMAYRAGFPCVYRFRELPDHEDYRGVTGRARRRTFITASAMALDSPLLEVAAEPKLSGDLWNTDPTGIIKKLRRFRSKLRRPRIRDRS